MKKKSLIILTAICAVITLTSFIEVSKGKQISESGDGKLIYDSESEIDPAYDYINYKNVINSHKGDSIYTIYFNDLQGECFLRFDFVEGR